MTSARSEGAGPLQGLRILLTRPQQQLAKWQALLEANGATTLRAPLMAIVPLNDAAATQRIKDQIMVLADYQHVIFVSQNAAHYGLDWIDQYWPQLPVGVSFYAVGSATARCLSDYGCPVTAAGNSMNSEELLALPGLQQVEWHKVLICRGRGGRPLLAEALTQRGAQVDYCELYERQFPQAEALMALQAGDWGRPGDLVALHSGEALHNWLQLLAQLPAAQARACRRLPLLLPGERVAALARAEGLTTDMTNNLIMAPNASDAVMLQALLDWRRHTRAGV